MLPVKWAGELAAVASFGGAFPGASGVAGDAVSALADYDRGSAVAHHVGHGSIVSPGVKSGGRRVLCGDWSGRGFAGAGAFSGAREPRPRAVSGGFECN